MNEKKYPRVLLISDAAWSNENNIGNTLSNLFENWPKDRIAMIYAKHELPYTEVCEHFFQISESRLLKSVFNKKIMTGKNIIKSNINSMNNLDDLENDEKKGRKMYKFFLKYRFGVFLFIRELLWIIGNWRTKELTQFVKEFSPDIIFFIGSPYIYMNNIYLFVKSKSETKSVIYFVDDVYTMRHISFSMFHWITKFIVRNKIRKIVHFSDLIYTIVPKQKLEYDRYFQIDTSILNKGSMFDFIHSYPTNILAPLKIVYTGNIYAGRWNSIIKLGYALDKVNKSSKSCELHIYTKNFISNKMKKQINKIASIKFMGAVEYSNVSKIQSNADILLHVESFKLRSRLSTRLSLSTKIIDYLSQKKCIIAIGWEKSASIEYLKENDIAAVITNKKDIEKTLFFLLENKDIVNYYAERSWNFGKTYHNIYSIRDTLKNNLYEIIQKHE